MTNRDELVDQYIDAVNAGQTPSRDTDDAELSSLYQLVDALQVLREPTWPTDQFAGDMALSLSSQLSPHSNGHAASLGSNDLMETVGANAWVKQDESDHKPLEAFPPQGGRLRQSLQIAGALAAFAAFALVLVTVFGDTAGETSGSAPADIREPGQIAFTMFAEGSHDIYLINDDGTGLIQLSDDPANELSPVWSPDGSQLAFVSDRDGSSQLYTIGEDGSNVQQLTFGPHQYMTPAWSPDGSKIAAIQIDQDDPNDTLGELVILNPDGYELASLTESAPVSTMSRFAWSPDGEEIAITVELSGRGPQVLVYQTDGGGFHNLYPSEGFQWFPAWSPDGNTIAITESEMASASEGGSSIKLIDVGAENARTLLSGSTNLFEHSWSPDGSHLAISMSDDTRGGDILIVPVDADAGPLELEDTSYYLRHPVWSPDGARIAFIRHNEIDGAWSQSLFVADPDGSNPVSVADNVLQEPPAWRPARRVDREAVQPETSTPEPVFDPGQMSDPPSLQVQSGEHTSEAILGSFNWLDVEERRLASVTSPFIDVGGNGLTGAPGSELRLVLPDGTATPRSIVVSLYTWQENNAVPTDQDGNVAEQSWFIPAREPVSQQTLTLDDPTFNLPDAAEHYVAQIEARWPDVDDAGFPEGVEIFATYAMNLYVLDESGEPDTTTAEAIEIVRQFLNEPDADIDVRQLDGGQYEAFRKVVGIDELDHFHIDMEHGQVVMARFAGHSSEHAFSIRVDEETALLVAESYMLQSAPRFKEMTVFQSMSDTFIGIEDRQDRVFSVNFAIQIEESGAWIPPRATIEVNMETGLVIFFSQSLATFNHSTEPTTTRNQAEAIALDHVYAMHDTEEKFEVERIDLWGFEDSMPIDSKLAWQVIIEDSIYFVDAHSGEIVTFNSPEIDQSDPPTGDSANANDDTVATEPEPDEFISKGDVVDILQAAFDIPSEGINLTLDETPDGRWLYSVNRIGDDVIDSFMVDARTGTILNANFVSHQPAYNIGTPIDEDTAMQMATDFASALAPRFADMTLFTESSVDVADTSADGTNYTASWSVRDPESGAWMPPSIFIVISLDSGRLLSANQLIHEYDGPTAFVVTEDEAAELAREIAGEIYPAALTGNLESVDLFGFVTLAGSRGAGEPVETTHRLVWRVYIVGVPMTPIDAITGDVAR